jgi:alginate O-acetyltransferase complex protein AlgJ
MQTLLRASRFLLPVAFFSYAAVVNLGYAQFPGRGDLQADGDLLRGGLTAKLETVYRQSLPHREPAIGMIGALRYLAVGEGRKGVITGSEGWLFSAEEVRPPTDDLDLSLARITRIRDRLEAAGARLVLVPVPGKLDLMVAHSDPETADGITALYDAFLTGLRSQGVPVLDARSALRGGAEAELAFFRTDTHWTPEGAEDVAQALAASGLVDLGDTQFDIDRAARQEFAGDLVAFVTSESLAPVVGLTPESATPFTAVPRDSGDSLDIFAGTEAGSTLLIGTSYSANPTFSFAEALKLALRRDVLNLAEEGRGPGRPMLDYLASPDFRDAPPEVVIWEFPVRYLTDPALWDAEGPENDGPEKSGA